MIFGEYSARSGGGGRTLPRVVTVAISRAQPRLPRRGQPLELVVSIHEEGTALTWQQHVTVAPTTESFLLESVAALHRWSLAQDLTTAKALQLAGKVGRTLYATFIGRRGAAAIEGVAPTAVMLAVDESILGLPWELLHGPAIGDWSCEVPLGRIVTTGTVPAAKRDPKAEDPLVRILVLGDPTGDLAATGTEIDAVRALHGEVAGVTVEVDVLDPAKATRAGLRAAVRDRDYDILHFAGHAAFAPANPGTSAVVLADGPFTADDVAGLRWAAPPYLVFSSACESARTANGQRLVSARGRSSGLASAFLAAGADAYLGHFWPVNDRSAADFAQAFYRSLFSSRNVGTAVLEARQALRYEYTARGDLAAVGAVFFGDAATAERRDLASMAPGG